MPVNRLSGMKQNFKPSALRLARILAGMTQRDVAAQIHRSPSYVHRLETGGSAKAGSDLARKIADTLHAPLDSLFREDPE